ncbi:MAG: Gfo/Idh/MocA family oxidoreductase [Pseudomonadota bacterium]
MTEERTPARVAFVGCGYVADFYAMAWPNAAGRLELSGVVDRDRERQDSFARHHGLRAYDSPCAMLADPEIDIVANLTNPSEHEAVSRAALEHGKHVYTEKPLAMTMEGARGLLELADAQGLRISSAPSSLLGEAAQTLWRAVRNGVAGRPLLVYAALDDGMIHRLGCENWRSSAGTPWPATDEFATGCTIEHTGYALSWLCAMFGRVERMVSAGALLVTDKGSATPRNYATPDVTIGVLYFESGVVARITNSIIAPHDHRMQIFCEDGELRLDELWDFHSPIVYEPLLDNRWERAVHRLSGYRRRRTLRPARRVPVHSAPKAARMDFTRGLVDLADAIQGVGPQRLTNALALHVTEVTLALQYPEDYGTDYRPTTDCGPIEPMPWAL